MLNLIHPLIGGFHITSLIDGALGGWMETLKAIKTWKSLIEVYEYFLVLLLDIAAFEIIMETTDLHVIFLSMNLD